MSFYYLNNRGYTLSYTNEYSWQLKSTEEIYIKFTGNTVTNISCIVTQAPTLFEFIGNDIIRTINWFTSVKVYQGRISMGM